MKGIYTAYGTIFFALISVILLKLGVNSLGVFESDLSGWVNFLLQALTSPFIWIGFFLLFCSSVMWLFTLSKEDLSKVFPLLSLNFVMIPVASFFLFGEALSFFRVLAITIICVGVVFLSKT